MGCFKRPEKEWKPKAWRNDTRQDSCGVYAALTTSGQFYIERTALLGYSPLEKVYWYKGKLHRDDGPAIIRLSGRKEWWVGGVRHRTDGPAVEESSGAKFWFMGGLLHRTDGPAVDWDDPARENRYFLYGEECTEEMHRILTRGPGENLILHLRKGYDRYIEERLRNDAY